MRSTTGEVFHWNSWPYIKIVAAGRKKPTVGGAIRNDGQAVLVDTELYSNVADFHEAPGGAAIGSIWGSLQSLGVLFVATWVSASVAS